MKKLKIDKTTSNFLYVLAFVILVFIILLAGNKYLKEREKPNPTVKYNNFEFQQIGGLWYTQWSRNNNLYTIPFHFNPYEAENVTTAGEIDEQRFNQAEIYIAFDPDEQRFSYIALAAAELSLVMAQAIDVSPVAACSQNKTEVCYNRPIVDCNSEDKAVIFLKSGEEPLIILNDNCITLQGKELGLLKATDKLLYKWLGILR